MSVDWQEAVLGDIATFSQGLQVPVEEQSLCYEEGLGRFIRIIDYTNEAESPRYIEKPSERYYASSDDVVMVRYGSQTAGKVVRGKAGYIANNMFKINLDSEFIDKGYLYYFLASNEVYDFLRSSQSSSTMPAITFGMLKPIIIRYPSLELQRKIASIIDEVEKKIELNRQTNQTLEHIAQAIFKNWFVDFEPTRAKIIAKEKGANTAIQELAAQAIICGAMTLEQLEAITQNLETTLQQAINEKLSQANQTPINTEQLKTTAALFPNALVESDGVTNSSGTNLHERSEPEGGGSGTSRLIPEGWHWSEIGDEVVVAGGGTPSTKKEEFWEGGHIHWTSPKDMSNLTDKILLETSRKITDVGLAKISSGLLPENTVLMSSRAPVGYLAITKIPVAINQGYIAMKCEGTLSPEYIVQWAESSMDDIKQRASGTTFAEISKKTFKIIPVVVPSKEAINAYTLVVAKLYSKITESLIEIKSLIEIRDSLLPKLLSGELNVSSD